MTGTPRDARDRIPKDTLDRVSDPAATGPVTDLDQGPDGAGDAARELVETDGGGHPPSSVAD